jgi:hypothetical protein
MKLEQLERGELRLPIGCSVTYDLEALNILKSLARPSAGAEAMKAWYESFRERHGERPTASEAWHAGYDPKTVRRGFGSWLGFVNSEGDLTEVQRSALEAHSEFLSALEVTPMTKSYKMLVLLAMLSHASFPGAVIIDELAVGVEHFARRSSLLAEELESSLDDKTALIRLLEENPIRVWSEGRGTGQTIYFTYEDGVFRSNLNEVFEHRDAVSNLTRELCDYRLAQYLERLQGERRFAPRIVCKVSHSDGKPILFLPNRDNVPGIPTGWQAVTANGEPYRANFVKVAINVMRKESSEENVLPDLLRGWFGDGAGLQGTTDQVIFNLEDGSYVLCPRESEDDGP